MITKFTEGNWEVSDAKMNGEHIESSWGVAVGGCVIANVTSGPTYGVIDEIQKANAHLLAASPKMYEMIKRLIGNYQEAASVCEQEGYETKYSQDAILVEFLLAEARGEIN